MLYNRFVAAIGFFAILNTTLSPLAYGWVSSVDEVEALRQNFGSFKSINMPQTVQGNDQAGAGILHYSLDANGEVYILLGNRDDANREAAHGWWCNFGGKGDQHKDHRFEYLHETAAREVDEESNSFLATHPSLVQRLPFVDTLQENKYYRMYWQRVEMVQPQKLKQFMDESNASHSKEYLEFSWLPLQAISNAINSGQSYIPYEGRNYGFYPPLLETLKTSTSQQYMHDLLKEKQISFSRTTRALKNRLHILNEKQSQRDVLIQPHFQIPPIKIVEDTKHAVVAPGYNAFGATEQHITLNVKDFATQENSRTIERKQPLDATKDRLVLAHSVAALGAANLMLKKQAALKTASLGSAVKHKIHATDVHLMAVLGKDYKASDHPDFKDSVDPARAADLANLMAYYEKYGGTDEFKHETKASQADYERFADMLRWERQNEWPVFFHGANAQIHQLIQTFTDIYQFIGLSFSSDNYRLRGTDIYFHTHYGNRPIDINDLINKIGYKDYKNNIQNIIQCFNLALTSGLKTTKTTSSSIAYFLSNHSVLPQLVAERFNEALSLSGFVNPSYNYFAALFHQFWGNIGSDKENSLMIGAAINMAALDRLSYPSHGGGRPFAVPQSIADGNAQPLKTSKAIERITAYGRKLQAAPEDFSVNTQEKIDLFMELRFLLDPKTIYDPKSVKMRLFPRFELDAQAAKRYESAKTRAMTAFMGEWLAHHNKIFKDAYVGQKNLLTLYKEVYEGITGQNYKPSYSLSGFDYLIEHNHIEGVKGFLKSCPHMAAQYNTHSKKIDLFYKALKTGSQELIDIILSKDLLNTTINELLKEDDIRFFYNYAIEENNEEVLVILEKYNLFDTFPEDFKRRWVNVALSDWINTKEELFCNPEYRALLKKFMPYVDDSFVEALCKRIFSNQLLSMVVLENPSDNPILDNLIASGLSPKTILDKMLLMLNKFEYKYSNDVIFSFYKLINNETDLLQLTNAGTPLLFDIVANVNSCRFFDNKYIDLLMQKLLTVLKANNIELKDIQNQHGQNIRQYVECQIYENNITSTNSLIFLRNHCRDFIGLDRYEPLYEIFGSACTYEDINSSLVSDFDVAVAKELKDAGPLTLEGEFQFWLRNSRLNLPILRDLAMKMASLEIGYGYNFAKNGSGIEGTHDTSSMRKIHTQQLEKLKVWRDVLAKSQSHSLLAVLKHLQDFPNFYRVSVPILDAALTEEFKNTYKIIANHTHLYTFKIDAMGNYDPTIGSMIFADFKRHKDEDSNFSVVDYINKLYENFPANHIKPLWFEFCRYAQPRETPVILNKLFKNWEDFALKERTLVFRSTLGGNTIINMTALKYFSIGEDSFHLFRQAFRSLTLEQRKESLWKTQPINLSDLSSDDIHEFPEIILNDNIYVDYFMQAIVVPGPETIKAVVNKYPHKLYEYAEYAACNMPYIWVLTYTTTDLELLRQVIENDPGLLRVKSKTGLNILQFAKIHPLPSLKWCAEQYVKNGFDRE